MSEFPRLNPRGWAAQWRVPLFLGCPPLARVGNPVIVTELFLCWRRDGSGSLLSLQAALTLGLQRHAQSRGRRKGVLCWLCSCAGAVVPRRTLQSWGSIEGSSAIVPRIPHELAADNYQLSHKNEVAYWGFILRTPFPVFLITQIDHKNKGEESYKIHFLNTYLPNMWN